MMRYQRVSPDCLSLPNGRKPSSIRACKDDEPDSGGRISSYAHFDAKPLRVRSGSASVPGSANSTSAAASTTQTLDHFSHFPATSDSLPPETGKPHSNHEINGRCSATGEVVLQWGHNKRSRGSRAENRTVGDESSVHSRQMVKVQRRAAIAGAEKIAAAAAAAAAAMPPPCGGGYTRGTNLRPCMTSRDSTVSYHSSRNNAEERSVGQQSRSDRRSPTSPPSKQQQQILHHHQYHNINTNHNVAAAAANGFGSDPSSSMNPESKQPSDQETGGSGGAAEKLNLDQFEWPRIYISLSRKEKEDDFLAMKGTKLPQRPKKRPKNVDKALQFCFPGMWLSELTRGRYEVREKKCVKKKCRGLKGMENMDSDSE